MLVERLDQWSAENKAASDRQRLAWNAAGEDAKDGLFAKATAVAPSDIVSKVVVAHPAPPTVANAANYSDVLSALAKVRAKPGKGAQGLELIKYAGNVASAYGDLQDKAAAAAKAAATSTQASTAAASASAAQ